VRKWREEVPSESVNVSIPCCIREAQRAERLALRDEIHQDTRLMKQLSAQLQREVGNETLWTCLELTWNSRQLSEREYMRACGFEVDF